MSTQARDRLWEYVGNAALVAAALSLASLAFKRWTEPGPAKAQDIVLTSSQWSAAARGTVLYGPPKAPATIVVFSDFQCPYCAQAAPLLRQISARNPTKVNVVFRHFPLPQHENAFHAAVAAYCAGKQGRFTAFHDQLFGNQAELTRASWKDLALKSGVTDLSAFASCLGSDEANNAVTNDMREGGALPVQGTPTIFVNRVKTVGVTLEGLQASVDRALKQSQQ